MTDVRVVENDWPESPFVKVAVGYSIFANGEPDRLTGLIERDLRVRKCEVIPGSLVSGTVLIRLGVYQCQVPTLGAVADLVEQYCQQMRDTLFPDPIPS